MTRHYAEYGLSEALALGVPVARSRAKPKDVRRQQPAPPTVERSLAATWYFGPVLISLVATVPTLLTLAPSLGGPAVTCDELYHVSHGKELLLAFRHQGPAFFTLANIARNFAWAADGPPVHPPLGNLLLAAAHHLFDSAPDNPAAVSVVAARFMPAVVFGLLVLVVGLWTARREGPLAGTVAAAATALVPRVFAHGHFAALDMITTFFTVAAVLAVLEAETRGGRWWHFALAGMVWGLAMLTRLHGVLLVVPIGAWFVARMVQKRSARATGLVAWLAAGVATLFLGWPWLWLAPIAHLRQFVGTGVHRQAIHVFYAGQVWLDHDVPWHYPVVMFLVTLPLGFLVLGAVGIWSRWRMPENRSAYALLLGTLVWLLFIFAWPGVPVYDGVRLFLIAFPLWAVFVGSGVRWLVEHPAWPRWSRRGRLAAMGLLIAGQATGIVLYHPCQLSHYNLLVGGLWGAQRLGFEVTYWGDAVTESLLAEAARLASGETVAFGPSLAPFQTAGVATSSPSITEKNVHLVAWEHDWRQAPEGCRFGIFYHRRADLEQIPTRFLNAESVVECRRQGAWLAKLVRFHDFPGPRRSNP